MSCEFSLFVSMNVLVLMCRTKESDSSEVTTYACVSCGTVASRGILVDGPWRHSSVNTKNQYIYCAKKIKYLTDLGIHSVNILKQKHSWDILLLVHRFTCLKYFPKHFNTNPWSYIDVAHVRLFDSTQSIILIL